MLKADTNSIGRINWMEIDSTIDSAERGRSKCHLTTIEGYYNQIKSITERKGIPELTFMRIWLLRLEKHSIFI